MKHFKGKVDEKKKAREMKHAQIKTCVTSFLERGQHIWTAQQVRSEVKKSTDLDVSLNAV